MRPVMFTNWGEWVREESEKRGGPWGPWGNWHLNPDVLTLEYAVNGVWRYEVDLERMGSSAGVLDWVFQCHHKGWLSDGDIRDLLRALDYMCRLGVQGHFCSMGTDRGRAFPVEEIRAKLTNGTQPIPEMRR